MSKFECMLFRGWESSAENLGINFEFLLLEQSHHEPWASMHILACARWQALSVLIPGNFRSLSTHRSVGQGNLSLMVPVCDYASPRGRGPSLFTDCCYCCLVAQSCLSLWPHRLLPARLLSMDLSGKNTGVGCHFLFQGIFPTQESNPSLLQISFFAGSFFTTEPPEYFFLLKSCWALGVGFSAVIKSHHI